MKISVQAAEILVALFELFWLKISAHKIKEEQSFF